MEENDNIIDLHDALGTTPTPEPELEPEKELEEEEEVVEEDEAVEEEVEEAEETVEEETETEEEEEQPTPDFNSVLSEKFGEFGLESEEDLNNFLEDYSAKLDELEALKKEKESTSLTEEEQRIRDFVKEFPSLEEGGINLLRLRSLDIKNLDGKDVLRESYVLKFPELTREEAIKLADKSYYKKYEEDPDEMTPIELKKDVIQAKNELQKRQEELKSKLKEAPKKEEDNSSKLIESAKEHYQKEFKKSLNGFDSIVFEDTDNPKNSFVFKLDVNKVKQVEQAMTAYLNNPSSYDPEGKVVGGFDPEKSKVQLVGALFADELYDSLINHGINIGKSLQVKEISTKKPERKSSASLPKAASLMDAFEIMAAEIEAKRNIKKK